MRLYHTPLFRHFLVHLLKHQTAPLPCVWQSVRFSSAAMPGTQKATIWARSGEHHAKPCRIKAMAYVLAVQMMQPGAVDGTGRQRGKNTLR
ncbi:MAG: hypothetical protein KL787_10895 [Taibaiella sp.]|nr:hypothetical protein [Taibaiella sp.]